MNELTPTPTPEFEEKMRAANRMPEANPAFVAQLRAQLMTRSIEMKPTQRFFSQPAWMYAFVVLLVLLVTGFMLGPQRVLAAMHALFGYVPGVGIVSQDAPIRVLAQPVSMKRDGITISVQQAVLDATHSVILYQVENLPLSSRFSGELGLNTPPPSCYQKPALRLPDGRQFEATQSYDSRDWQTGYGERLSYAALPANVDDVVFYLACIDTTVTGAAPEKWEIPLHFVPAPPQMTVYPVIDVATATPSPSPSAPAPQASPTVSGQLTFPYGISLALEHVIPLKDGYLLQASMKVDGDGLYISPPPDDPKTRLLASNGQEIPLEASPSDQAYAPVTHMYYMDYKIASIPTSGPLTLSVDSVSVGLFTKATFTFDPGKDPQPGQTWPLNQDVNVDGYIIHLKSAHFDGANSGYSFEMESDTGVSSAMVTDLEHPVAGGGGSGDGTSPGSQSFSASVMYANGLPKGPVTITFTDITIRLTGPWQVSWTPPPGSIRVATPTLQSRSVCLTSASLEKALANPEPLPAGVSGKLAFDAIVYPPNNDYTNYQPWKVAVANLDGSDTQTLTVGSWASFSPNGRQVVYGTSEGLTIVDLKTNTTRIIPNTPGFSPLWSPDGNQIAFIHAGTQDIYLVSVDGLDLQLLPNTDASDSMMAWLPDGSGVLLGRSGPNGTSYRILDLTTDKVKPLFNVNYGQSVSSISPDGKRLAFSEKIFGNKVAWYVSDVNGSHRKLIIDTEPSFTISPAIWGPDSHWLVFTASDQAEHPNVHVMLLQVDTCQIVSLPAIVGNVSAWTP